MRRLSFEDTLLRIQSDIEAGNIRRPEPDNFTCEVCNDSGMLSIAYCDLKSRRPQFPKRISEPCQCREERDRQRIREAVRRATGIPPRFTAASFANFSQREDVDLDGAYSLVDAGNACRTWAEGEGEPWLILWGGVGVGKSHLAAAALNDMIDRMAVHRPLWLNLPDWLDSLKADDFAYYQDRTLAAHEADALVIDDLGAEYHRNRKRDDSSWSEEQIYRLVNHRYDRRLPTLFTTNGDPAKMSTRIADRMLDAGTELTKVVKIQAPSYRRRQR